MDFEITQAEILTINNREVLNIIFDLFCEIGAGSDCYMAITFYGESFEDEDNWTLGWLEEDQYNLVEKWLKDNGISKDKQFLIEVSY